MSECSLHMQYTDIVDYIYYVYNNKKLCPVQYLISCCHVPSGDQQLFCWLPEVGTGAARTVHSFLKISVTPAVSSILLTRSAIDAA